MTIPPADRDILERRVAALVTSETIAEHRACPIGEHSAELTEILHFLRRSPDPALPSYVVLLLDDPPRWTVGMRPPVRGADMIRVDAADYGSREEAEHAVFLRRLADYGLIPATQDTAIADPVAGLSAPIGYGDAISLAPGERLTLRVHSPIAWTADLVRLYSADLAPEGSPLREVVIDAVAPVAAEGIEQRTPVGCHVRVDLPDDAIPVERGLGISLLVMPTLPGVRAQALVSHRDAERPAGWSLMLDERGAPALWLGDGTKEVSLALDAPLVRGCWYRIAVSIDPAGGVASVASAPVGTRAGNRVWMGRGSAQRRDFALDLLPARAPGPLLLAASRLAGGRLPQACLDGRLEAPTLLSGPQDVAALLGGALPGEAVLARWDFAAGIGEAGIARPSHVADLSAHGWHGRCHNHPTRGVTGHCWDGSETNFRHAPSHYAAAHFHSDNVTDCDWAPQVGIDLPADLPSGLYAARLTSATGVDHVPFIVRPPQATATAPILLVLPTNAYLAYANDHVGVDSPRVQMLVRRALQFDAFDMMRHARRDLGASMYEAHLDGSGICYSSWRRPILTMRPGIRTFNGRIWQFTSDLQIIDWLERSGRAVDIVSDLDLHREGRALLDRYRCVMTGTHPEYWTEPMLDAVSDHVDGGGRFVYMGGNGLYWVTGYDPEDDQVIEIRRWGGSQSWQARPGEYHLSFTGESGGLWRNRGRAPQKLTGVGFVAAGLHHAGASYRPAIEGDNPAAWVLDGVAPGPFGEQGTGGAAAGLEIDATDPELGTPAATIVVASSGGRHTEDMLEARENYGMTLAAAGGARNARVRSDMVLVPGDNGGGVFSTGSIAWAGSLAHDEAVSRILGNVLDRFCSEAPLIDG